MDEDDAYDERAGFNEDEAMMMKNGMRSNDDFGGQNEVDESMDEANAWTDIRYPTDLQDNAWVWKLLILSFALGVCSCLCYYATKVKPAAGKRYDFGHGRHGKYSQVGLDSAYDYDDIIDQRSVIEQTD